MRSVTITGITIAIAFTLHATDAWSCSPGEVSGISLVDGAEVLSLEVPVSRVWMERTVDVPGGTNT